MSADSVPAASRSRRRRPQISLSTILLAIAACAVWFAYRNALLETKQIQRQLPGLQSVARELLIKDPDEYAVVFRLPTKWAEAIWDLHLPYHPDPQYSYRLCLALDQIDGKGLCEPLKTARIQPGKHMVELRYQRGKVDSVATLLIDDEAVLEETRPKSWESGAGSTGGSSIHSSRSFDPTQPLVLYRKIFMYRDAKGRSHVPQEPGQGILVWIERDSVSDAPNTE